MSLLGAIASAPTDWVSASLVREVQVPARGVVGPDAALRGAQDDRAVVADGQRADPAGHGLEVVGGAPDLDDRVRALAGPRAAAGVALDGRAGDGAGLRDGLGPQSGGLRSA